MPIDKDGNLSKTKEWEEYSTLMTWLDGKNGYRDRLGESG